MSIRACTHILYRESQLPLLHIPLSPPFPRHYHPSTNFSLPGVAQAYGPREARREVRDDGRSGAGAGGPGAAGVRLCCARRLHHQPRRDRRRR
eukprot:51380-Eustigmatos_ZCMA.PRE.1